MGNNLWTFMSSFTMNTHQIWSCHVTLAANFEKFYFSPNSMLNFRESCQIWGKLAQEQKSYRQKAKLGVKTPPPRAYRVKTDRKNDFILIMTPKNRIKL